MLLLLELSSFKPLAFEFEPLMFLPSPFPERLGLPLLLVGLSKMLSKIDPFWFSFSVVVEEISVAGLVLSSEPSPF